MGYQRRVHGTLICLHLYTDLSPTKKSSVNNMKVFCTVFCLFVAVYSAQAEVSATCTDSCDHLCNAALTNCIDVTEGMCAKLDATCKNPCYHECTCNTNEMDVCAAAQAACEEAAGDDIALTACKVQASMCQSKAPAKCTVEEVVAAKPYEKAKESISKLLPGVNLPEIDTSKLAAMMPSEEELKASMPDIGKLSKMVPSKEDVKAQMEQLKAKLHLPSPPSA